MITAPLFVVVLLVVVLAVKTRAAKGGSVVLGLVLGLTLASTSLGAPILAAVTDMSNGIVHAVASIGGQHATSTPKGGHQ